ncbi:diacylglycerol/lipid kinase family protein [Oceanobacillus saliphilus]|uniref:diacylglycerol/lipid kinase family protein n=1 Tax=Oceanobacillus saliphilus TaxID=2925834 RepID=UPI00201D5921|nr:diacylglycerol kinase family protein [Oceanobacillus saliphilus]
MYIFIINPKAGFGLAQRIFSDIQQSDTYRQMDRKYYFTEYEGHGEEIASQISNDPTGKTIIVIGGDGTIHEIINGLTTTEIPLGFIPGGSGNDFARGCGIKGSPQQILQQIVEADHTLDYWIGKYSQPDKQQRKFANSIGFGFDAVIAKAVNESNYKNLLNAIGLGTVSYVIALLQVLITFKPMSVTIEVNGKTKKLDNCWMVSIGNHPYYGGGMKIIPHAVIQPKVLPVLIIHSISKWKVLALFITVFFGNHASYKEVEVLEAKSLKITSVQPILFQVDGQTDLCRYSEIIKQAAPIKILGTAYNKK